MKISIIIPVYMSRFFLFKNFENLKNQTYNNIEIIYVNDGSPDDSGIICENFKKMDSRVNVIHQANLGAAEALNTGINNSTGDCIMFLDADDWIELNTCELAISTLLKLNVNLLFWPNIKEYASKSVPYPSFFKNSKIFLNEDINYLRRRMIGLFKEELSNPMQTDAFNAGWGKLYRSDIIKKNKLKWTDTKIVGSSDVLFNAQLMPYVNSAYYLNSHLHHYNKNNPNSLTKTYNYTLEQKFRNLFKELQFLISVHYTEPKEQGIFQEALNNRIVLSIINISLGYVSKGMSFEGYKMFCNLIKSDMYEKSLSKMEIKYLPLHFRLFFIYVKINSV